MHAITPPPVTLNNVGAFYTMYLTPIPCLPARSKVGFAGPLYCQVTSAFATGAAQSC